MATILIFLKAPIPGTVKTRLAQKIGDSEAVRVYRQLVERQLSEIPPGWPVEIHYAPAEAEPSLRKWLGEHYHYAPQSGGDLGDRMRSAVKSAFDRGIRHVLCIGADCPDLSAGDLLAAEEKLTEGNDLVFGPAFDGGYYLVALSKFCPEIFSEVPWSSTRTLITSLLHAKRFRRRIALLETKNDVDTVEDWEQVKTQFLST
ncbi:MAG: TIGR04282 family arsenosugar biosynthesis glycosyltransferase [Puniceicoccales bacterium]